MNVVILGSSFFAFELAHKLRKKGNITLIIEDKEKALEASMDKEMTVISGKPNDSELMDKLKLDECDVFVAATDMEEINILTALYAQSKGAKQVFVKTVTPEVDKMLHMMKLHPINADEYAAANVALFIVKPLVADLVGIEQGDFSIAERHVTDGFKNLIGKKLLTLRGEFFVIFAVHKEGKFLFSADTEVTPDSILIILYERGRSKDMEKSLKEISKEKEKEKDKEKE